jgi:hypothetical protein
MSKIPVDNGSSLNKLGGFPPELTFSERVAEVRDSPNSLRIRMKNYPILIRMGMY